MIEVITYADFVIRIPSLSAYEESVKEVLLSTNQEKINVLEIADIHTPERNLQNGTLECGVYSKLSLCILELASKPKVDDYLEAVVPFLQRHLKNCNKVNGVKIVQMKRILDDPNIQEHSITFD